MQRASLKMQASMRGEHGNDVQDEQKQLEMYLIEPECERAIEELIREKKLDFVLFDLHPDVLAVKLSDLLNSHCVAYFISKQVNFKEKIRQPFFGEVFKIVEQVAQEMPDMNTLVKVFKLKNKGPLNERIEARLSIKMDWKHWWRLRDDAITRLVKRKLADCIPYIESSIKKGTKIVTFETSRPKDVKLRDCLLWGKITMMASLWSCIKDSIRERIERMVQ